MVVLRDVSATKQRKLLGAVQGAAGVWCSNLRLVGIAELDAKGTVIVANRAIGDILEIAAD